MFAHVGGQQMAIWGDFYHFSVLLWDYCFRVRGMHFVIILLLLPFLIHSPLCIFE
jgi:hypothetical protein